MVYSDDSISLHASELEKEQSLRALNGVGKKERRFARIYLRSRICTLYVYCRYLVAILL